MVFTSGTESKPKGCSHTWNTFGFSAKGLARDVFEATPDDVVFMPSPLGHATGLIIGLCRMPIVAGCGTHVQDVWNPNDAMARIARYRCTLSATAAPFVRMAMDSYDASQHDMSSMRFWLCAGAPSRARSWPRRARSGRTATPTRSASVSPASRSASAMRIQRLLPERRRAVRGRDVPRCPPPRGNSDGRDGQVTADRRWS